MPPRSVTKWLEIATAQKLRPLWANEFKDVLVRAKVNDIVVARDRDSFSEPWRRVLLKKVSKTTWLLLDENGKALDEPDCPCSGFTEKSLLEEAGMDYYDFPFDDVPPCATSPSATNDDKDEDDALCAAVDAFVSANGAKAAAAAITTAAAAITTAAAATSTTTWQRLEARS